jgi:hypothetical protein
MFFCKAGTELLNTFTQSGFRVLRIKFQMTDNKTVQIFLLHKLTD